MPLAPGTRLGNYEIDAPLGAGGMGEVYRARDVRLGRAVAIKSLPDAFARDPERLARFEREAQALAAVHHANIATIFGIEDVNGSPYLALELVDGVTLTEHLARNGALSVADAIALCAQVAAAVDAAHAQGIVHRDLKPGNVMVTPAGIVKVLDFGLAKAGPGATTSSLGLAASPTIALGSTAVGAVLGTASYMSPEQARGKEVDRRADVWALGCILYECLCGRQAFAGETASDVLARVIERDPDWSVLPGSVPTRLRDVLRRCLTKNAADRPRDVGDLRGELLSIASDLSSPTRSAAPGGLPSIAVLYFQNQTNEPESDYFADGIAEDLLTDLSKFKGLRVASRSSVARYRGTLPDTAKVATELGVGNVLEGSVRRAGNQVRITVRLVSADGFQIWAERYDRKLDDVFAVQEEIASSIATELKLALTPAETERLATNKPAEFRAYDLYLKGREQYGHYTPQSLRAAIALFEQSIAVDPAYALAYAGLGDAYGQLLQWSDVDPAEDLKRRGLEATRRAIELNPRLPEAHKAEALLHTYDPDADRLVLASLQRALDCDPRFMPALNNLGVLRMRTGQVAPAERAFRRALEVAPDDPHTMGWLGFLTMLTARYEESKRHLDRVRALTSDPFYVTFVHSIRAEMAIAQGRAGELESLLRAAREDGAPAQCCGVLEAYVAARTDRLDVARRLLDEFGDAPHNFTGIGMAAVTALRLGDRAKVTELLQRRLIFDYREMIARISPVYHPLLDLELLQPRRSQLELVWPLEAPMIDATRHRLFRKVSIESGRPTGSDVFHED